MLLKEFVTGIIIATMWLYCEEQFVKFDGGDPVAFLSKDMRFNLSYENIMS